VTKFGFIMTIFTGSSTVSKFYNIRYVPKHLDVIL